MELAEQIRSSRLAMPCRRVNKKMSKADGGLAMPCRTMPCRPRIKKMKDSGLSRACTEKIKTNVDEDQAAKSMHCNFEHETKKIIMTGKAMP